jgi:hypothetical protein
MSACVAAVGVGYLFLLDAEEYYVYRNSRGLYGAV